MVKKCCRLCFEEKFRPIGIFTAKGIKLKIGEIIQKHFLDEISESDIFPKFVCVDCWTKLSDFHNFYNGADEAKRNFLKNTVKEEEPIFTEIYCEALAFDGELVSAKHEPIDDIVESATPAPVEDTVENRAQQDIEKMEDDSNDHYEVGASADDDTNNESETDGNELYEKSNVKCNRRATTAASVVTEPVGKITESTENDKKKRKKELDDLVAKYMRMNCVICNQSIKTTQEAKEHYRYKHAQRCVNIKCCDRKLRLFNIRDHIRYHVNPDVFKCNLCHKRFVVSSYLRTHMQKHLPKEFECDICKKKFSTLDNIRMHLSAVHTSEISQYDCHVCTKRFATKTGLQQHVNNVHERINEVVCHICAKVYSSKVSLRRHLLDHSGISPPRVSCEICGSTFKSEQNRTMHVKRHQESGVPCPQCHKISPNRNALKSHIISVHSSPMLQCNFCDKKFKRTLALKEHVATHTGEDLYICNYCPQKFKYHSSLYLHYRGVHPIEWNADRRTKPGRQRRADTC